MVDTNKGTQSRYKTDSEFRARIHSYYNRGYTTQKVAELENISVQLAGAYLASYNIFKRKELAKGSKNVKEDSQAIHRSTRVSDSTIENKMEIHDDSAKSKTSDNRLKSTVYSLKSQGLSNDEIYSHFDPEIKRTITAFIVWYARDNKKT
jgi:hypothetical protein